MMTMISTAACRLFALKPDGLYTIQLLAKLNVDPTVDECLSAIQTYAHWLFFIIIRAFNMQIGSQAMY